MRVEGKRRTSVLRRRRSHLAVEIVLAVEVEGGAEPSRLLAGRLPRRADCRLGRLIIASRCEGRLDDAIVLVLPVGLPLLEPLVAEVLALGEEGAEHTRRRALDRLAEDRVLVALLDEGDLAITWQRVGARERAGVAALRRGGWRRWRCGYGRWWCGGGR